MISELQFERKHILTETKYFLGTHIKDKLFGVKNVRSKKE